MKRLIARLTCWFKGHPVPYESLKTECAGDAEGNGRVISARCQRCGRKFCAPYGLAMRDQGVDFIRAPEWRYD